MGADIHMVVECKYQGKWIGMYSPDHLPTQVNYSDERIEAISSITNRNYRLFHHLASVRSWPGWGPSLLGDPRGYPDDMSDLARFILRVDEGEYHSASWCTMDEFMMAYNLAEAGYAEVRKEPPQTHNEYALFGYSYSHMRYWGEGIRIVFAFDN